MNTVFLGGSRRINGLSPEVTSRIDRMIRAGMNILVGDANGADKAIQAYLSKRHYSNVVVFCTAGKCRNNVGAWKTQAVKPPHRARDFEFFTAKDAAMAQLADAALMLWDGQSNGTIVNVARMIAKHKPAVLYIEPKNSFATLKSRNDLEGVLADCSAEIRNRIGDYIATHAQEYAQAGMF